MAVIDNLIGYWSLDEASGSALDSHGSNPGTETSGTIPSVTGKVGGARDFEVIDTEYFEIADNATMRTGDIDFTVAAWVQLESKTNGGALSKYNGGAGSEYFLGYVSGSDRFTFILRDAANTGIVSRLANTLGAPSLATWYYLVGWHDSVANTINIQVNNGTVDSTAYSVGVFSGTEAMRIGCGILSTYHWDGLIDEAGFWKKVLTVDERTWLYNGGAGRSYADIVAAAGAGVFTPYFYRQHIARQN